MRHSRSEGTQPGKDRVSSLGWLLSASTVSNLADGIARVAFPLLAADATRDPVLIAGLSATQFLPWLLFGMLAGTLLDRTDRRLAIVAANLARAAAIGVLTGMIFLGLGNIVVIYAVSLLVGTAETVADSAANVLIPTVAAGTELERANSKLQATEIIGETFLGGPIGSLTYALFAVFPFLLDTVGFAVAGILLLGLRGKYHPRAAGVPPRANHAPTTAGAQQGHRERRGLGHELGNELMAGLRWLRSQPLVFRMVVIAGVVSLTSELAQAQLVLYALEDLALSEAAFGVFAFVGGIGGLFGAALTPRLVNRCDRFPVLLAGITVAGVGFVGMGISGHTALSAILFGLFAGGIVTVNVVLATVRHAIVPGQLLGRVLGVWRTAVWGTIPAGALLGGLLTEILRSPSATFRVAGAALLVTVGLSWLLLRGQRRNLEAATPAATVHNG